MRILSIIDSHLHPSPPRDLKCLISLPHNFGDGIKLFTCLPPTHCYEWPLPLSDSDTIKLSNRLTESQLPTELTFRSSFLTIWTLVTTAQLYKASFHFTGSQTEAQCSWVWVLVPPFYLESHSTICCSHEMRRKSCHSSTPCLGVISSSRLETWVGFFQFFSSFWTSYDFQTKNYSVFLFRLQ